MASVSDVLLVLVAVPDACWWVEMGLGGGAVDRSRLLLPTFIFSSLSEMDRRAACMSLLSLPWSGVAVAVLVRVDGNWMSSGWGLDV